MDSKDEVSAVLICREAVDALSLAKVLLDQVGEIGLGREVATFIHRVKERRPGLFH